MTHAATSEMFHIQNTVELQNSHSKAPRRPAPTGKGGKLQETLVAEISDDRRSRRRYDLDLQLQYKIIEHSRVVGVGPGQIADISSSGAAFWTNETLKPGSYLELSIPWPVPLNDGCALKLIVEGRVIRSQDGLTAMRVDRYEFRTAAKRTMSAAVAI